MNIKRKEKKWMNETNTKDVLWKQIVYIIDTFFGMVVEDDDDDEDDNDGIITEKLVRIRSAIQSSFQIEDRQLNVLYTSIHAL